VEFKDLAPRWDGRAVVVSDGPVSIATVLAPDRQRWLAYAIIGVFVLVVAHFARWLWLSIIPSIPRTWALCLSSGQLAAIGLAALVCGVLCQFISEAGLLSHVSATQSLQIGYAGSFIPKVRESRVRRLLGTKTVFVDARLARDYERGHLQDAISLPIDANDAVWEATTAKIPRNTRIVTYCQSAGCKFAETVSLRLIEEGYADVSIFKGGWAEWASKHGRSQPPAPVEKEAESDNAEQNDPA
jgi:rhodanese-related sulfurtransferase